MAHEAVDAVGDKLMIFPDDQGRGVKPPERKVATEKDCVSEKDQGQTDDVLRGRGWRYQSRPLGPHQSKACAASN